MSYSMEAWARKQRAGNARAKAVLIELAHCHNEQTGKCCPSVAYLSRVTELKPDTVSAATDHLVRVGLITKEVRKTASGRGCFYGFLDYAENPADTPENGAIHTHEFGDMSEFGDTPENGATGNPETGVTHNPENGGTDTPENGDRTGNKNREVEQGIRTGKEGDADAPAPAPANHPVNLLDSGESTHSEKQEEVAKGRKQKADEPGQTFRQTGIESLPEDWAKVCEEIDPEVDPNRAFTDFVSYWRDGEGKGRKLKAWKTAWTKFIRGLRGCDWKRRPLLKDSALNTGYSVRAAAAPRRPTDPQAGLGVCQPPKGPHHIYTEAERLAKAEETRKELGDMIF